MKGGVRERERIFSLLINFPCSSNSRGWIRPKRKAWNSILVSQAGRGTSTYLPHLLVLSHMSWWQARSEVELLGLEPAIMEADVLDSHSSLTRCATTPVPLLRDSSAWMYFTV